MQFQAAALFALAASCFAAPVAQVAVDGSEVQPINAAPIAAEAAETQSYQTGPSVKQEAIQQPNVEVEEVVVTVAAPAAQATDAFVAPPPTFDMVDAESVEAQPPLTVTPTYQVEDQEVGVESGVAVLETVVVTPIPIASEAGAASAPESTTLASTDYVVAPAVDGSVESVTESAPLAVSTGLAPIYSTGLVSDASDVIQNEEQINPVAGGIVTYTESPYTSAYESQIDPVGGSTVTFTSPFSSAYDSAAYASAYGGTAAQSPESVAVPIPGSSVQAPVSVPIAPSSGAYEDSAPVNVGSTEAQTYFTEFGSYEDDEEIFSPTFTQGSDSSSTSGIYHHPISVIVSKNGRPYFPQPSPYLPVPLHHEYSVNTTAFKPLRPAPDNETTELGSGASSVNGGVNGVNGTVVTYDTLEDFEAVNDEHLAGNGTKLQFAVLGAQGVEPMYYIPREVMRHVKVHLLEAIDNILGHY